MKNDSMTTTIITDPLRGSSRHSLLSSNVLPLATLVASFLLSLFMWREFDNSLKSRSSAIFDDKTNDISSRIQRRMHDHEQVLRGAAGLFAVSNNVSRTDWRHYVSALQLDENHPGILGIGFSKWLTPEEKDTNISMIRSEGFPEYSIRPEGVRSVYTSIIYLEPFNWRNQRAFGYDMYSEPLRRAAMDRARDENIATIAAKIILVQETDKNKQSGILMYVPVYRMGMPVDTVEHRREAFTGFVYSPIRMNDFVIGTLTRLPQEIAFDINVIGGKSADTLMFSSIQAEKLSLPEQYKPSISSSRTIQSYDCSWQFTFTSLPGFNKELGRGKSYLVLCSGILISVLFSGLVFLILKTRNQTIKLADEKFQNSEARFRQLLQTTDQGIYGIDLDGCCTFINTSGLHIIGYQPEECIGMNMHALIHHSHANGLPYPVEECPIYRAKSTGQGYRVDSEVLWRKNGTSFLAEYSSYPLVENGKISGAVVTFSDITEKKHILEQLAHKQEQLETLNLSLQDRITKAIAELRQKDQVMISQSRQAAMGEMIGNIAHQWRQPLNALSMVLGNIMSAYQYDELTAEYIEKSVENGNRLLQKMSTTINDFSNFFRPDKEIVTFSAIQQINHAVSLVQAGLTSLNISLHLELSNDVLLTGFPNEYSQVLLNLLSNARDAIKESAAVGTITIRLYEREDQGCVSISDNGGGIPDTVLDKIFEPYFSTKQQGTGIGLYMSKMIIERSMSGTIEVHNIDCGAEFIIVTPQGGKIV